MKSWSLVNDVHMGANKNFTLLFHNTKNTKVIFAKLNLFYLETHVFISNVLFLIFSWKAELESFRIHWAMIWLM